MSFTIFRNKQRELSLVFDIASGAVGGAIVEFGGTEPPRIIYNHRKLIFFDERPDSGELLKEITKKLDTVAEMLSKEGLRRVAEAGLRSGHIKRVHYIFSSPWVVSHTKVVTIRKESEFKVTRKMAEEVAEQEQDNYMKSLGLYTGENNINARSTVIEHLLLRMRVNGYDTMNPFGREAKSLELPFFMSVIDNKALEAMESAVAKHFHYRKSSAHSFVLSLYTTLQNIWGAEVDFIAVDINGELTDITLIRGGVIAETASFPLGINSIVRHAAKALSISTELAESRVQVYMANKASDDEGRKIREVLLGIRDEWVKSFEDSFASINYDFIIPRKLFLIVNNALGNFFAGFLKNERFKKIIVPGDTFDVTLVDLSRLKSHCTMNMVNEPDPFLALETIALNYQARGH